MNFVLLLDVCDPNPCLNNATCMAGENGTIICTCPEGFTGERCKTEVEGKQSVRVAIC